VKKETYKKVCEKIINEKRLAYKKLTKNEKLLKKMRFTKELMGY